ncbi:MAG: inositol monophosphatase family protein, partial [Desulfurococcaceae archaeon]
MKDEYLRIIGYRIIKKVSLLLKKYVNLNNIDNVVGKGYGGDYSFKIDTLIEEYIINQLKEFGLKLLIVSEENGLLKTSSDIEYIVLIDPLDGSINYVSKIPVVSTSIVFYSVDKPYLNSALAGVVSNVFLNEIYSFNSSNVFINENKISSIERKIRGLVSIYTEDPSIVLKIKSFNKNYLKTDVKIRTLGSSSIESIY